MSFSMARIVFLLVLLMSLALAGLLMRRKGVAWLLCLSLALLTAQTLLLLTAAFTGEPLLLSFSFSIWFLMSLYFGFGIVILRDLIRVQDSDSIDRAKLMKS